MIHLGITHRQSQVVYPACLYSQDKVTGTTASSKFQVTCEWCKKYGQETKS